MGTFLGQLVTIVGLLAGGIAVGSFLGNAGPSLRRAPEPEVRRATTLGGLAGLALMVGAVVAVYVNVLS